MERDEIPLVCAVDKITYVTALPVLKDLSNQIFYVGSNHRIASVLKLALYINIALISLALAEGLVLARGTGMDPGLFVKILNSTYFKTGISEKKDQKL